MAAAARRIAGTIVFSVLCQAGVATAQVTPSVRVAVRLANIVKLDSSTVATAQQLVTEIYADAGVEVMWFQGNAPSDAPALQLTVNLIDRPRTEAEQREAILGFALVGEVGCGRIAYVVWGHIRALARAEDRDPGALLGPVMAHEIGHLLLAGNAHAPSGIMRAHWTGREFDRAGRGGVGFTPEQAARMRTLITDEPVLLVSRQAWASVDRRP